jgi:hypothetical protein
VLVFLPFLVTSGGAAERLAILSNRYSFCFGYSGSLVLRGAAISWFGAAGCTTLASVVAQVS